MEFSRIARTAEDAAYVTIGFGVLAFQKAQVRRREIQKQLTSPRSDLRTQLTQLAKDLEERFEPVVEGLESRLPSGAKEAVQQARKAARDQFPNLFGTTAQAA